MSAIGRLLGLAGHEPVEAAGAAPVGDENAAVVPVEASAEDEALSLAARRHDEVRARLEGLRVRLASIREQAAEVADRRGALLRRLVADEDAAGELAQADTELARLRSLTEGLDALIRDAEVEEAAARETRSLAAAPVAQRRHDEAIVAAERAAVASHKTFCAKYAEASVALSDVLDALDAVQSVAGDASGVGRRLAEIGSDPLSLLVRAGWRPHPTRAAYYARLLTIEALCPPEQG